MADQYCNFDELSRCETSGIDFSIRLARARAAFAIVAPHGGGIEPGTSEIAEAIAGDTFSFYAFDGLKSTGNSDLHITSTRFDEPLCSTLLAETDSVVTIHGEQSEVDGAGVFLGGIDTALGLLIRGALEAKRFLVRQHADPDLQGLEPSNLCNRGKSSQGVQLELSRDVRETMFESLSRAGRRYKTARFDDFVAAVSAVLEQRVLRDSAHVACEADGPSR